MGEIEPTTGEIIRPQDLRISYLSQEFEVDPQRTVRDEFWTVFDQANQVQHRLHEIPGLMETADPDQLNNLIHELDEQQRYFEALGGYGLEARIEKILPEMGFDPTDGDRQVGEFSGGWQMRMGLGKILLQEPDVLLLDEPTNHLDLDTIEWLEGYLKGLNTPMVIVSHDREFLDRLCTQIVETERGVSTTYLGNYSAYLTQKQKIRRLNSAPSNGNRKNWLSSKPLLIGFGPALPGVPKPKAEKNNWIKLTALKPLKPAVEPCIFAFHRPRAAAGKSLPSKT
jgi:ATP-binding cassette subfamily F protein 3